MEKKTVFLVFLIGFSLSWKILHWHNFTFAGMFMFSESFMLFWFLILNNMSDEMKNDYKNESSHLDKSPQSLCWFVIFKGFEKSTHIWLV